MEFCETLFNLNSWKWCLSVFLLQNNRNNKYSIIISLRRWGYRWDRAVLRSCSSLWGPHLWCKNFVHVQTINLLACSTWDIFPSQARYFCQASAHKDSSVRLVVRKDFESECSMWLFHRFFLLRSSWSFISRFCLLRCFDSTTAWLISKYSTSSINLSAIFCSLFKIFYFAKHSQCCFYDFSAVCCECWWQW